MIRERNGSNSHREPILAEGAAELGPIDSRWCAFHEQINLLIDSGETELGAIARSAKAASKTIGIDRELIRARLGPLREQVTDRSRRTVLASLELKRHDGVVAVVLRIPVASDDGACITRVGFPAIVRRAKITTVVGDKRSLDKLHDAFTRESEAGEEWAVVMPLGREKLIENLRVQL